MLPNPRDILTGFPGWCTAFELVWRQELSRQSKGTTIAKDLGTPLWSASYQTRTLDPNELDAWRARLDAMDGAISVFKAIPLSRCYPILYPRGAWPTGAAFSGTCQVATAAGKTLSLAGLPAGYTLSVGDMLSVTGASTGQWLFRVMETAVGGAPFEVRPALPPGLAPGNAVSLKNPWVPMRIAPGSVSSRGAISGEGALTFSAVEAR